MTTTLTGAQQIAAEKRAARAQVKRQADAEAAAAILGELAAAEAARPAPTLGRDLYALQRRGHAMTFTEWARLSGFDAASRTYRSEDPDSTQPKGCIIMTDETDHHDGDHDEWIFGDDELTGIVCRYVGDDCHLVLVYEGQEVWPTRTAAHDVIARVLRPR